MNASSCARENGAVVPLTDQTSVSFSQVEILRFHGPQPDAFPFEIHQSPITLLRISMATPHALALSVIFDTRNFVSL